MPQFYKVLKADPLGEPYTPNFEGAKATQTFWCQLEGVDKDVSIGKQVPNTLTPGESIYGDLVYAKSQRGTEYWKFKSSKVPEGVQRPATTPAQATAQQAVQGDGVPAWFVPYGNMIDYIYKEMKKMDADSPEPAPATPEKVEPLPGSEPLSEEEQTKLDDIFGGK